MKARLRDIKRLRQKLLDRTSQQITIFFNRAIPRIKKIVQDEIRKGFDESDEVQSMIYGVLRSQLGLTEPKGKIKQIVDTFVNSIGVSVKRPRVVKSELLAELEIRVGSPSYEHILGIPAAQQERTDAQRTAVTGPPLEWLRWLLMEGSNRIIIGFTYRKMNRIGRSGLRGVMVQQRKHPGRSWSVPPEYQGYPDNNFITRLIDKRAPIMQQRIFTYVDNTVAKP